IELHPTWLEFLASDKLLFSVNQTLVKASHPIQDGDEVAFFPPVTGG
ncbi:MAG TPA: MoaD/ThiS family protein, partial [Cellvibrio sp.]|nr:MoaD/ThiS family protein [Cellvibrio sp.]